MKNINISEKKGAALAYAMMVGVVLIVLAAALLPLAGSATGGTQTVLDDKLSYIEARSAIEYAKAILGKGLDDLNIVDFYVTAERDANGEMEYSYRAGVPSEAKEAAVIATVDELGNSIMLEARASTLGQVEKKLNLEIVYHAGIVPILKAIPTGYAQVGLYIGSDPLFKTRSSSSSSPSVWNHMPIVFKETVNLNSRYYDVLTGKALYFMGLDDSFITTGSYKTNITLMTNFLYFKGDINLYSTSAKATSDVYIKLPTKGDANYDDEGYGYAFFDNITLTTGSKASDTKVLNGIYRYSGSGNFTLTQFANAGTSLGSNPRRLTGTDFDEAKRNKYDPNILFSTYDNRMNWITGEEAGWLNAGAIINTTSGGQVQPLPVQADKFVSMYITNHASFEKRAHVEFNSRSTRVRTYISMNNKTDFSLNFGYRPGSSGSYAAQTAIFTGEYVCFENFAYFYQMHNDSKLLIKHPAGKNLILQFNRETTMYDKNNKVIGIAKPGMYVCPSGFDLFDPNNYADVVKIRTVSVYIGEEPVLDANGNQVYDRVWSWFPLGYVNVPRMQPVYEDQIQEYVDHTGLVLTPYYDRYVYSPEGELIELEIGEGIFVR